MHSESADVSAAAAVQTDGCHGQQVARCGRQLSKCHSDALLSSAVFCWVIMYVTLAIGYCINSELTVNRKATWSSQLSADDKSDIVIFRRQRATRCLFVGCLIAIF